MVIDNNESSASGGAMGALDDIQSARSRKRIDQIDQIRSHGIGDIVSLPQIVVCGDQSAGKSSVLEGTTGIPFPKKDGICTRFPTEIILRRNLEKKLIVASVQPHTSRPAATRNSLSSYRRIMSGMAELPEVTFEVSALMGLRGHPDVSGGNAFSSDVLRIEVTGYTDLNLTVVDLPGLISVANEDQTDADVELIRAMVERYVSSSRAIVLAVIQAGNDIANQSIIELARKHDPELQRTVGIITKADLINEGTEGRLIELAMNQGNIKLEHGFFLLKNPTPAEMQAGITVQQRLLQEMEFFSSHVWQSQNLDMSRVGVINLKMFLQDLLDRHIEKELPNVIEEVKQQLRNTEVNLSLMGLERSAISDIRCYVIKISMDYYQTIQAALNGDYYGVQRDYFQADSSSKLRAVTHRLNTNFAARMRDEGQKRKVSGTIAPGSIDEKLHDSGHVLLEVQRFRVSEASMNKWVRSVYENTRGRELPGDHNYVLIAELFREQSSPWESLARGHIQDVFTTVTKWIHSSVREIVPEARMSHEIISICLRWLDDTKVQADEELKKIVADEGQPPLTYNHYYTDNIQTARHDAAMKPIKDVLQTMLKEYKGNPDFNKCFNVIKTNIIVDMDQQACSDALISLDAYYKAAMKTFVDNVCRQVIERHIFARLPDMFSPSMIAQLPDEQIMLLGSESKKHVRKRKELGVRKLMLRASLDDLQQS